MHTDGTIGVDLLAHTHMKCHASVMLLCRVAFQGFLLLAKAKTVIKLIGPISSTPKKCTDARNVPITMRALKHHQGHSHQASAEYFLRGPLQHRQGHAHQYEWQCKAMSMVPLEQLADPK